MKKEAWPTEPQKPEINNIEIEKPEPEIYQETRAQIELIVNNSQDSHEAIEQILNRLESFFKHIDRELLSDEKIEEIKKSLLGCEEISDKNELTDEITNALKQLLVIKQNNPEKYEDAQALSMNETGGFTAINRLLSYGKSGSIIHFHAPAGKFVDNKFSLYRQGMRDLAKIVNDDPEIETITATSPFAASNPGIFTMMGFDIQDISEEEKEKYFGNDKRDIKRATIGREDFLKKFLKDKE